jgi:hypothetical protein
MAGLADCLGWLDGWLDLQALWVFWNPDIEVWLDLLAGCLFFWPSGPPGLLGLLSFLA